MCGESHKGGVTLRNLSGCSAKLNSYFRQGPGKRFRDRLICAGSQKETEPGDAGELQRVPLLATLRMAPFQLPVTRPGPPLRRRFARIVGRAPIRGSIGNKRVDCQPVLGTDAKSVGVRPDHSTDDDMRTAAYLDIGPARRRGGRTQQKSARRNVEDAGVAP